MLCLTLHNPLKFLGASRINPGRIQTHTICQHLCVQRQRHPQRRGHLFARETNPKAMIGLTLHMPLMLICGSGRNPGCNSTRPMCQHL